MPGPSRKVQARGQENCLTLNEEIIIGEWCRDIPTYDWHKNSHQECIGESHTWPVPVSFSYSFKDSIEELKTNIMLYCSNVTRDISLNYNAVNRAEIEQLLADLWEIRVEICHFKPVVKEENKRNETFEFLKKAPILSG